MRVLFIIYFCAIALGSHAQTCYQNAAKNLGMPAFYHKQMDQKACEIIATLGMEDTGGFEIIGIDLPRIFGGNLEQRYAKQFDKMVQQYEKSSEGFVLISKELKANQTLHYRSHIQFPKLPGFQTLSKAEKDRIMQTFSKSLEHQAKRNSYKIAYSASVEIAGLRKLNSLFEEVLKGTSLSEEIVIKE